MKNIFKIFGVIVLSAVIGFSMAACGGDDGDDDNDDVGGGYFFGDGNVSGNGGWTLSTPLNGVWENNGVQVTVSESAGTGVITSIAPTNLLFQSAVKKGYIKKRDVVWRNLTSTGTLTWSGEYLLIAFNTSDPNVAIGTQFFPCTFTMGSADGTTLTVSYTIPSGPRTDPWTRKTTTVIDGGGGTAPTITTTSLPGGTVGTAYNQTLTATGDTPITWSFTGTLPAGLSLAGTGVISGMPTTAGTSNFNVIATNAKGSDTKALTITIAASGGGGSLAGTTWKCTETYAGVMEVTYTLTFTISTVKMEYLGQTVNGTYTVNGGSITVNWDPGYTGSGSFSINGNRLTSSEGNVFIKQ